MRNKSETKLFRIHMIVVHHEVTLWHVMRMVLNWETRIKNMDVEKRFSIIAPGKILQASMTWFGKHIHGSGSLKYLHKALEQLGRSLKSQTRNECSSAGCETKHGRRVYLRLSI